MLTAKRKCGRKLESCQRAACSEWRATKASSPPRPPQVVRALEANEASLREAQQEKNLERDA